MKERVSEVFVAQRTTAGAGDWGTVFEDFFLLAFLVETAVANGASFLFFIL